MLTRLLSAFRKSEPEPLPEPDTDLALGALLVRVAMSDNEYQIEEISRIDRILAKLFDLDPVEAAKMRATCEKLHRAAPDTDVFAELIRLELGYDDRLAALEALWQVVLADGEQQQPEVNIVRDAQLVLGLSDVDSATARARAMNA
ncbi:TerB family tellurite resistance protein [Thalassococcus sp. S3]|uniref:tellurite resistance TerB family protein n=1 Tax=Thalassococcus sp. S3 TaxID=2017482 RepID=UPI0010240E93|nr:TerB family tellurite resistance protein [Thalassococcus sp. S3]QBF32765.1 hypothetical protein CFI11_16305 [Thalassococcus sp. S3]